MYGPNDFKERIFMARATLFVPDTAYKLGVLVGISPSQDGLMRGSQLEGLPEFQQ